MSSSLLVAAKASKAERPLDAILGDLRSKHDEIRFKAAQELYNYILASSRSLSAEAFNKTYSEIHARCFALVNSSDLQDKLAGVTAIDKIVDVLGNDMSRAIRLAASVQRAFPCSDSLVMTNAAKVFARLAAQGGILMSGHVDTQVKSCIEWLQGDRIENRRYAAVLILRELTRQAPGLIYEHLTELLDNLWTAMWDPKVAIREAAADALAGCLLIATQRDGQLRVDAYNMVFGQAQIGFKTGYPETIHGSLLGYKELFLEGKLFMADRYGEVCDQILFYKDHRDPLVRRAVIELIPTIASYNANEFAAHYLSRTMAFLLDQLKKDRGDRATGECTLKLRDVLDTDRTPSFICGIHTAFQAIGRVALQVKSMMTPYLDPILNSIKDGLLSRGRKNQPAGLENSIFQCIGMLAQSVGPALTKHMHELLDLMFAYGLSPALHTALQQLGRDIPPLLPDIQERILNLISMTLADEPFVQAGAPHKGSKHPDLTVNGVNGHAHHHHPENQSPERIMLALEVLGTFNFKGVFQPPKHLTPGMMPEPVVEQSLGEFVRDHVIHYVEDDNPDIRRAAALSCCQVLSNDPIVTQASNHAIKLMNEVLEKLLTLAIADPDPSIRQATISHLDPNFDRHLAQADCVRSLFIALNDEVYAIRESAIRIIGRLATLNPAHVMPSLRKTLIQLLTELEYSTASRNKEEASTLLGLLVGASQRLTKPYVTPMLNVLLPKSRDASPSVAASIVTTLGELTKVGGEDVLPSLDDLMSLILDTLHDQASTQKRDAALRTLGQLASYAGYVIDPYLQHPSLLGILISLLKTEPAPHTRREVIRVMGALGALDPYRHSVVEGISNDAYVESFNPTDPTHPSNIGPSHEEYYPTVAFNALLGVFSDPSLSDHHTAIVDAIIYIFRSLRLKVVTFLPQVLPVYLNVMRTCPVGLQEFYFQNLSQLIQMVKQHVRNHLAPILAIVREFWNSTTNPGLQVIIIDVIQSIALALDAEFKAYLPNLLPLMLKAFDHDFIELRRQSSLIKVLHAFAVFGTSLEEYLHLIIPAIVSTFERPDVPAVLRRHAMQTMSQLCRKINFADHASRIIHPLARVLANPASPLELRVPAMDAMCSLLLQMGPDFVLFVPMIHKILVRQRISYPPYQTLVDKLLAEEPLPQDLTFGDPIIMPNTEAIVAADAGMSKLPVNQVHLKSAWEIVDRPKADDWREWIKRISVQMLKSSPSLSLRACANLAEVYHPLARDLFNAGFVSVWGELYDNYQEDLVRAIQNAFSSPTLPPEITQQLLNLAEFMEHDDKVLPIPISTLGQYALKCRAYAKALHYKELEVLSDPSLHTIEELIRINNSLQQPDVSVGILVHAHQRHGLVLKEEWYIELERWEDALAALQRKAQEQPDSFDVTLGRMRCLHALGEWESLAHLAQENWARASHDMKRKIAPMAAAASWGLAQWESMDTFIGVLKHDSADRAWFRSILSIHRGQFNKAQSHINKARDLLDTELTTLVGESYNRAYDAVVRIQMLSELEEIISYKEATASGNLERRNLIQRTWMKRLLGCKRDVDVWQRILKVRALVVSPHENIEMWVKFANLCRKSGRLGLADKTLNSLMPDDIGPGGATGMTGPPEIIYAHLKYMWATGAREETLGFLRTFTSQRSNEVGLTSNVLLPGSGSSSGNVSKDVRLLARLYYKLGEWQSAMQDNWGSDAITDILQSYLLATKLDPTWYKAWHAWALANSEVVSHYAKSLNEQDQMAPQVFIDHLVPAVEAFFHSIALSPGNSLQDTLRLLTLWFKYGGDEKVYEAIMKGMKTVSVDTWLDVIPQLIARIHAPSANVRSLIDSVLTDVGKQHPQALVYPLTVASKYPSAPRRSAAVAIIDKMKVHSEALVAQALLVSQELIRVAILWNELWHEGLEEASRLFYGDHNIDAMFATLAPLHDMLERGPETLREIAFAQTFGRDLADAREACNRYRQFGEIQDLNHAWDLYYQVFRKINKNLPTLTLLELQYVSPKLLAVKNLDLAIPGTYQTGKKIVRIASFGPTSEVFTSKQRPRKLRIVGSDGVDYNFLLKGHEDLRQDERVMQLFGLVNTLLQKDSETFKRHLTIVKYPVIPLSPNSGLLGWVNSTDTLHVLIKNYRDSHKILLNIEHRLILQMAPDFDHLCLMQKLEVFEYSLDNTTGQDFYRVMWLKSRNSEAWLDRRSNYCRTLAVMSMVGHILGLGDRHPSNLLMDRVSGRIVHVDFGDCFEVAMQREKHPEKVPFRLTRMLMSAMEVSGIEGTFKITCQHTMRVLRENKESIIAVLEAFVHDPLINWRLVQGGRQIEGKAAADNGGVGGARRPRGDETNIYDEDAVDQINTRAVQVVERVQQKLTGRDFKATVVLSVNDQVDKLIAQATSLENLSQCFIGWCEPILVKFS
ncbi:BZ3500_MvSof-1268-A1-R1_Chr6-2g08497 [Microbotryum saponariae]|uniref:Serine/threonine-protein kinase TOR n=1 Tax=Microbotryum saponariae TaxID=289078 RepID=A0A2X0LKX4_9BASI|nr:BZ3500_MvSof-1268-A1-R1_Chr6-2g08497 [Microbotryum saponariae]SDA07774.1 BZ3501_MvSof-1269-A2-R1_Chr6-1g08211 [Microbotryum saponariae]